MRAWVDVYNSLDVLQGTIYNVVSLSKKTMLDGAGSISFSTPGVDEAALTLLTSERKARMFVEHDGVKREVGRGVIRKIRKAASSSGYQLSIDGPDSLDALNRKSVLLGRSYTNQPISTIAAALTALVSGFTISVDASLGNQTARFDGTSVLKSLIRVAAEKGLHIREGVNPNSLELGAFGVDNGIWAVAPQTISRELMANDSIVIVDSITQDTDSQDVVNWCVPIGSGEGSAALTLKNAVAVPGSYAIGTMAAPDGSTLYYLTDSASVTAYGQNEKIVTFKEIGPVSNSDTAKTYAAQALYDAACAWLSRNKDPLITYRCSVRKPRASLRAGDKMRLTYKGFVETAGGDLVPINVDARFWIMDATERISDSGDSYDLVLASVDRVAKDTTSIVVDALEAMAARNLSVQTFPFGFQDSSERVIQGSTLPSDPQYKTANFSLQIPDIFVDVIKVSLHFITRPLYTHTEVGAILTAPSAIPYSFAVLNSPNYPSDITLAIDGIDRTVSLGGAWNPSAGNSAVDTTVDITTYIVNAVGGLYQTHTLVFAAGFKTGEGRVSTGHPSAPSDNVSNGVIECKILFLGTARATVPNPT